MVLFCTGAVTMASNSRATQPARARSRRARTWRPLAASRRPAVTGAGAGSCSSDIAGAVSRPGKSGTSKGIAREAARAAMTRLSPAMTRRPGKRSPASIAQRSGPTPAGSPAVSTTSGEEAPIDGAARSAFFETVLDERPVARLAQPILEGFVGLARPDRLAGGELLAVFRELVGAARNHLHQVPPERCLDRLAHRALGKGVHGALEFRHGVSRGDPAQVAAARCGGVLGVHARELREVAALLDALAQPREAIARLRIGHSLARAQQDVPHVRLLDADRRGLAALLEELEDVEAVGAADDVAHLADVELFDHAREERRQPRGGAPPERAALERVRRVREGRGDLREVAALAQLRERLHGAPAALIDHLGGRLRRDDDEDVRQAELRVRSLLLRLARKLRIHFGVGHHDGVLDLALAQARQHDLVADVLAELGVADAVLLEGDAEVAAREVVLLRDAVDGALERRVVPLDPALLRELDLDHVVHHALEDLRGQHLVRGKLPSLALQLARHEPDAVVQLVVGYHFVGHHG